MTIHRFDPGTTAADEVNRFFEINRTKFTADEKLHCSRCGHGEFLVWNDLARCAVCHLKHKLMIDVVEDLSLNQNFIKECLPDREGRLRCPECHKRSRWSIYSDRIRCAHCRADAGLEERILTEYFPLCDPEDRTWDQLQELRLKNASRQQVYRMSRGIGKKWGGALKQGEAVFLEKDEKENKTEEAS